MALSLNFSPPYPSLRPPSPLFPSHAHSLFLLLSIKRTFHQTLTQSHSTAFRLKASSKESENAEKSVSELIDNETLSRISSAKEAGEVLTIVAEKSGRNGGVVSSSDCGLIINAALERSNAELAFSVYSAMRMSFDQGVTQTGWKWARPDVHIYASLVKGLASSLRVSDAIRIIYDVCQTGIYTGDEVSFGKVVRCPSCMIAVAVVQPQHGTQIASCSKCRYQYELVSGDIVTIQSEQIRGIYFLWC